MAAPEKPHEQYVVDAEGRRVGVILDIAEWEHILEELEELDDIRAVEEARNEPGDAVDAREFFDKLYRERGWPIE